MQRNGNSYGPAQEKKHGEGTAGEGKIRGGRNHIFKEREEPVMKINAVSTEDLRRMEGKEGLVLRGCGGETKEWVDGINQMLTEEGILLEGQSFRRCRCLNMMGCPVFCTLFEDVRLDMGKFAIWRLQTHDSFGGTWLSDYVPNRLGGFADRPAGKAKPDCALIGEDSNIFNLAGVAAGTLREHGLEEQADELKERVCSSSSYHEALHIISGYVNITSKDEWGGLRRQRGNRNLCAMNRGSQDEKNF